MRHLRKCFACPWAILALALSLVLMAGQNLSAATNDYFASAANIASLPFTDVVDNSTSTLEPMEPQVCAYSPMTVWYSFTPAEDAVVRADMSGSSFDDTTLNIYQSQGPGFEGLSFITCVTYSGNSATFAVQAGTTYYFQAGSMFSLGVLQLNLAKMPPPLNDDFYDALPISGLPFSASIDTSGATLQDDEPAPQCSVGALQGSVWYSFAPSASGPVSINISASFNPLIAVYAGSDLVDLTELDCRNGWAPLTFQAYAGVVYYLQIGSLYGPGGFLQLNLDTTPPPVANFFFYPSEPSSYDRVQFINSSYDPGQSGFVSEEWDFGDGTAAAGCCPIHQFSSDNDYQVALSVTTFDGRSASTSQVVRVRSHDVSIVKFSVPQAARVGQTRQISVGLSSKLYAENVQVQLLKSVPGASGGFEAVGMLMQFVPVRSGNRTTDFSFSYTFTPADAAIGKVTFKAVALIDGHADALPADNEAIATPTKVSR